MKDTFNATDADKAHFLRVFAAIGACTSLIMAINSYLDGYLLLSLLLASAVVVFALPFVITKHDAFIAVLMLYSLYALMSYLVVSGGSHGTGPLWLFIVSPVTFFIRGLKQGAVDLILLAVVVLLLFIFTPNLGLYQYDNYHFPARVMLCFAILCALAGFYEYYRNKYSRALMQQLQINEQLARTDAMTGLSNRRYALECLTQPGFGAGAVYMLLDADNFKQINDGYGHQVGDQVLRFIAATLKDHAGPDDIVARWGGEEFLLVVHNTAARSAKRVATQIMQHLQDNALHTDGHSLQMTLSIGAHQRQFGESIDHCLNIADKRLYLAKSSGKNRVVFDDDVAMD
ncbi:GGDEF domain-containing protein [Pseudoalteromonas sp. T1lg22]|uniref:GGDEF domain-containing protein n=1 Tax=Pseudoalteromonas sp. T1lg22 TaxID=2077096 RepID=UPI000CF671AE|nr:GGDEF domain-containing protein [Pseudoalteromonas sp. T1lg22]